MRDLPSWPLHTRRLVIRPIEPDDIKPMWEYRGLPDVTTWTSAYFTTYDQWRDAATASQGSRVVATLPDGRIVGDAALDVSDAWHQAGSKSTAALSSVAELGWAVHPDHSGLGYATEMAAALLQVAFRDIGVRRVTASAFADNAASIRVMEKIGMRREATTLADSWHATRGWTDGAWYALLAEEWESGIRR